MLLQFVFLNEPGTVIVQILSDCPTLAPSAETWLVEYCVEMTIPPGVHRDEAVPLRRWWDGYC